MQINLNTFVISSVIIIVTSHRNIILLLIKIINTILINNIYITSINKYTSRYLIQWHNINYLTSIRSSILRCRISFAQKIHSMFIYICCRVTCSICRTPRIIYSIYQQQFMNIEIISDVRLIKFKIIYLGNTF